MMSIDVAHPVVEQSLMTFFKMSPPYSGVYVTANDHGHFEYSITGDEGSNLYFSVRNPNFAEMRAAGGEFGINKYYAGMTVNPMPDHDYTLRIDTTVFPPYNANDPATLVPRQEAAAKIASFRRHFLAGPYEEALTNLINGTAGQSREIQHRINEHLWVLPAADRVSFVFEIQSDDTVDTAMARVFLQEF